MTLELEGGAVFVEIGRDRFVVGSLWDRGSLFSWVFVDQRIWFSRAQHWKDLATNSKSERCSTADHDTFM